MNSRMYAVADGLMYHNLEAYLSFQASSASTALLYCVFPTSTLQVLVQPCCIVSFLPILYKS